MKVARTVWTLVKSEGIARDETEWRYGYEAEVRDAPASAMRYTTSWSAAYIYEPAAGEDLISGIAYYFVSNNEATTVTPYVYESDSNDDEGTMVWSGDTVNVDGDQWVEISIPEYEKVLINEGKYYWIILEMSSDGESYLGYFDTQIGQPYRQRENPGEWYFASSYALQCRVEEF